MNVTRKLSIDVETECALTKSIFSMEIKEIVLTYRTNNIKHRFDSIDVHTRQLSFVMNELLGQNISIYVVMVKSFPKKLFCNVIEFEHHVNRIEIKIICAN
jgi:hypothetical protein